MPKTSHATASSKMGARSVTATATMCRLMAEFYRMLAFLPLVPATRAGKAQTVSSTVTKPVAAGSLSLSQGIALYVGAVLGTGVIALPALAARAAGPASLLAWL